MFSLTLWSEHARKYRGFVVIYVKILASAGALNHSQRKVCLNIIIWLGNPEL